jgi:hypothetical protein
MNALFVLIVAESFAFGAMWHNKSARSGMERESERPDPAVLFSSMTTSKQEANKQHPRALKSYFWRSDIWCIVTKLRRASGIEIPIGYQDESGFHRILESPSRSNNK